MNLESPESLRPAVAGGGVLSVLLVISMSLLSLLFWAGFSGLCFWLPWVSDAGYVSGLLLLVASVCNGSAAGHLIGVCNGSAAGHLIGALLFCVRSGAAH
ncbi:hypothetical protein Ancab_032874 [Ancistrocladus abbreviatus]